MTGHLKVRNGVYYAVINFKDRNGNYKQKWISTGLKERGNKKQAKEFLEAGATRLGTSSGVEIASHKCDCEDCHCEECNCEEE